MPHDQYSGITACLSITPPSEKVIAVRVIGGHRQRLIEINGIRLLEVMRLPTADASSNNTIQPDIVQPPILQTWKKRGRTERKIGQVRS